MVADIAAAGKQVVGAEFGAAGRVVGAMLTDGVKVGR